MRLHSYKWNRGFEKLLTTVILTTYDIEKGNFKELTGAGFEILVLPKAYEKTDNVEILSAINHTKIRGGEVVYV